MMISVSWHEVVCWHSGFSNFRLAVIWDGRDEYGQLVASGVFIAHLRAGKFVQSRKMLLVR